MSKDKSKKKAAAKSLLSRIMSYGARNIAKKKSTAKFINQQKKKQFKLGK